MFLAKLLSAKITVKSKNPIVIQDVYVTHAWKKITSKLITLQSAFREQDPKIAENNK